MTFDQTKFDALVDYILDEHGPMRKEELSWRMWLIDSRKLGKPITGARYIDILGATNTLEIQDDEGNVVSFDRWVEA